MREQAGTYVSLSFDDGRKDVLEVYQRVLKPRNIPVTLNIPTGCVDGSFDTKLAECGEESLNVEAVRLLAKDSNVEIASHGDRHCNGIQDAEISLNKIRSWSGVNECGFASPRSLLPENEFLSSAWNSFSYMRSGPVFCSHRWLRIFARKAARVLHVPCLYAYAYQGCIMEACGRVVYAVPVMRDVRFAEVRALVESAIRKGGSLILMFHGVADNTAGKDNWVWATAKMEMLCSYLQAQEKQGRIGLCMTKDLVAELQKRGTGR